VQAGASLRGAHEVAGWNGMHPVEQRSLAREHEATREHRLIIPRGWYTHREERLCLGGEVLRTVVLSVEQRLHPEAVARREEPLIAGIPDDERKLATQVMQALGTEVLVEMQCHLAVGPGAEAVAPRLEASANPLEVVELTVMHDDDRAVLVRDRLIARREVDDRQPRVTKPDPTVG